MCWSLKPSSLDFCFPINLLSVRSLFFYRIAIHAEHDTGISGSSCSAVDPSRLFTNSSRLFRLSRSCNRTKRCVWTSTIVRAFLLWYYALLRTFEFNLRRKRGGYEGPAFHAVVQRRLQDIDGARAFLVSLRTHWLSPPPIRSIRTMEKNQFSVFRLSLTDQVRMELGTRFIHLFVSPIF
jgi:hypothetical protein